ncbi:hypothetical protein, partial [Nocardia lijiangensis]|uniref:hypothetical protein n=1 Tax=Nocardia lijiangensis TaxID=299618 RepID=UPI001C3FDDE5
DRGRGFAVGGADFRRHRRGPRTALSARDVSKFMALSESGVNANIRQANRYSASQQNSHAVTLTTHKSFM